MADDRKTSEQYFADWESHVFGFGYGSGEEHTIGALKEFFGLLEQSEWQPEGEAARTYDYRKLEAALSPRVAWLMINILCHADILEYGTSPRFGWLTAKGERLRDFIAGKSVEALCETTDRDEDNIGCYPDACNCGPDGYDQRRVCQNPFWGDYPLSDGGKAVKASPVDDATGEHSSTEGTAKRTNP